MSDDPDAGDDSPSERTAIHRISIQRKTEQSLWRYPRRYLISLVAFLGFCNLYALRVNLSVAIVAMTTNKTFSNGTISEAAEFDWNPDIQGIVLSSFFYGYIVTQIPGGFLAATYGGKRFFGIGVAVTSAFTLITPLLARTSLYLLVTARVMEGLFEGITYPAMHAIWARWAPPLERSKLAASAFSGSYMGTVIALPMSGFLADYLGWASVFYVPGILGLLWFVLWCMTVSDNPQSDPRITDDELNYINSTLGSQASHVKVNTSVPWKRMMMSFPVWAIIIAHFSENWGFYTLLTELPTFMNDVFGFDLHKAGILAALPYLAMGIIVMTGGFIADYLRLNKSLSTLRVRKLFNCGGFLCQTVFLLLAAHSSSPAVLMIFLTIAVGFGGFAWSGFGVNHLDIAPAYAGILMGVSNTFATLPGMISPVLTGHIVEHKTPEEWQVVFYIASAVYLLGAAFYAIFASGEEQIWANLDIGLLRDEESYNTEDLPFGDSSCD
ncbi:UNVERIFIED_CONTAM: hypothetical protein PYX00_001499 [Menopon gallinae]|uniref:Sialin n=1 Tax=Menopon gallinae TaxID=328185 RepID=A0AAW2ICZ7_9NEOP